jgi:hypothetical protein
MKGFNVILRTTGPVKMNLPLLVSNLASNPPTDESIGVFLKYPFLESIEPAQSAVVLRALSSVSIRGSALSFSPELRNKKQWVKMVQLVSDKVLSTVPPVVMRDSNRHVTGLCTSLSRLRCGSPAQLRATQTYDAAVCFPHLLRYAAEVNAPIEEVCNMFS